MDPTFAAVWGDSNQNFRTFMNSYPAPVLFR
jgi:hypothetical protein